MTRLDFEYKGFIVKFVGPVVIAGIGLVTIILSALVPVEIQGLLEFLGITTLVLGIVVLVALAVGAGKSGRGGF